MVSGLFLVPTIVMPILAQHYCEASQNETRVISYWKKIDIQHYSMCRPMFFQGGFKSGSLSCASLWESGSQANAGE